MLRPLVFLAAPTLLVACQLAFPTEEREERVDSGVDTGLLFPGPCKPPGHYCGTDKVPGDRNTLYLCVADADARVIEKCEAGCVIAPPGTDDYCK